MHTFRAICLGLITIIASTLACSSPRKPAPPVQAPAQKLWGDMTPIVSVKELMRDFIDL